MKSLAMIKYTLYEYLRGTGFMILILVFGMIFLVFGIGLSVEETITGQKITLLGVDISGTASMLPEDIRETVMKEPALFLQQGFVMHAAGLLGPMFFILIASRVIESMLTCGNRHLLLSKPMRRYNIFLSRLGGFMIFSAIVVYMFLGGLWLIIGLKTGSYGYQIFVAAPVILLIYLSLLSIITLITLVVENFFVAAGMTVGFFFVTTVLGALEGLVEKNDGLYIGWMMMHSVLPRTGELASAIQSMYLGGSAEWFSPIMTTLIFSVVVISAATFLFSRKEY